MVKTSMRPLAGAALAALGLTFYTASPPAHAGLFDSLFAASSKTKAQPGRREWNLHDFTSVRLVPRETGSPANEHPIEIEQEALRQQLAQIRIDARPAASTLFAADELTELLGPLSEALAAAGPDDDVLLLSTARRGGVLLQPSAVTARLFVQSGRLHLIAHDTRQEFMNELLGGRIQPQFAFGSRGRASAAVLRSGAAEQKRSDWLTMPLAPVAAAAKPQAATAAPAAAPPAAAPAPPAAAPAPPALRPRDPGFADEIEQRLLTLKRLRERGLITEDEYQQKRREILQLL